MKIKSLLLLLLFPIYCFSQVEVTSIVADEVDLGVVNISWVCDTTVTKYCYFYIGEYERQTDTYGYTHTFAVLLKQPTVLYKDFQCSSITIVRDGDILESWMPLYEKYVNEDFTLKEGTYVFGIGTGDGFYQTGQMRSVILHVIGNNILSIDYVPIENSVKYIDYNSKHFFIRKNNHIYNIYGFETR